MEHDDLIARLVDLDWVRRDVSRSRQRLQKDFARAWSRAKGPAPAVETEPDSLLEGTEARIRTARRLVELYASGDAGTKRTVRAAAAAVRGFSDLLLVIAKWYAADARGASAAAECELAVEAISLENCASDFRDTLVAMGEIWLAFDRNGLDPRAAFARAAAGADRDPSRGGRTPVAEMLTGFETSAYLASLRRR